MAVVHVTCSHSNHILGMMPQNKLELQPALHSVHYKAMVWSCDTALICFLMSDIVMYNVNWLICATLHIQNAINRPQTKMRFCISHALYLPHPNRLASYSSRVTFTHTLSPYLTNEFHRRTYQATLQESWSHQ